MDNTLLHKPLISIIIPLKNREELIVPTLVSIQHQTYSNWEAIVIDDHSEDQSVEVVKKIRAKESRIHVFTRKAVKSGGAICRNEGLLAAKGDYIVFLDSDDLMAPWALEQRILAMLNNDQLDAVIFPMLLFNHKIDDLRILDNIDTKENALDRFLKMDRPWLISGPLWRKDFLIQIGLFDETLPSQQDYDLHVRALCAGMRFHYFSERPDMFYRRITTSSGTRDTFQTTHLISRKSMLLKHLEMLKVTDLLNEQRKPYFARNLFAIALAWRFQQKDESVNARAEADELLNICRNEKLLPASILWKARLYLIYMFMIRFQRPIVQKVADKIFKRGALLQLLPTSSPTATQIPYKGYLYDFMSPEMTS
jgi:glycosyltransferase involved in cell wall biosynthesis